MNKTEAAIELIKAGDSIYQDWLSDFSEINFETMDNDEKRRKINQYAILYAQIIEYYLKALILPDLKNENYNENSVEEMNFLANDSSGLRKYNHIFKRIIFDSAFDEKIRNMIIDHLANHGEYFSSQRNEYLDEQESSFLYSFGLDETDAIDNEAIKNALLSLKKYRLINTDNISNDQKLNDLLTKILDQNNGAIANNSDAYPKSRYAMIDPDRLGGYTACLEFLIDFYNAIRNALNYKINNCVNISNCYRHIFPDCDTKITINFVNGSSNFYYFDSAYNLWITDDNGNKIDTVEYIENYDRQTGNWDVIEEIIYIENSKEKRLKYDTKKDKYTYVNYVERKENNLEISKR